MVKNQHKCGTDCAELALWQEDKLKLILQLLSDTRVRDSERSFAYCLRIVNVYVVRSFNFLASSVRSMLENTIRHGTVFLADVYYTKWNK